LTSRTQALLNIQVNAIMQRSLSSELDQKILELTEMNEQLENMVMENLMFEDDEILKHTDGFREFEKTFKELQLKFFDKHTKLAAIFQILVVMN